MAGNEHFTPAPLTEEHGQELSSLLEELKKLLQEKSTGSWDELDDRALKPLQQIIGDSPSERHVRSVAYGLGEILQRQFDLDWVTAKNEDGEQMALHIPLSFHLMFPDEWFVETVKNGKPANVRTTYLKWANWIGEHQFDEDGEIDH